MIKFTTVQELIDGGYKLHANCHNWHCQNNQALDLVDLRERLGPDFFIGLAVGQTDERSRHWYDRYR
jgi:hypothetical protein